MSSVCSGDIFVSKPVHYLRPYQTGLYFLHYILRGTLIENIFHWWHSHWFLRASPNKVVKQKWRSKVNMGADWYHRNDISIADAKSKNHSCRTWLIHYAFCPMWKHFYQKFPWISTVLDGSNQTQKRVHITKSGFVIALENFNQKWRTSDKDFERRSREFGYSVFGAWFEYCIHLRNLPRSCCHLG